MVQSSPYLEQNRCQRIIMQRAAPSAQGACKFCTPASAGRRPDHRWAVTGALPCVCRFHPSSGGHILSGMKKRAHFLRSVAVLLLVSRLPAGAAGEPGLDLTGMDRSVRPGDDFFRYANGSWLEKTAIPADRSSWGSFAILAEEADRRVVELIQGAGAAGTDPDARKVADYYAAFMDENAIEARGAGPLRQELDAIAALRDKTELARF